MQTYWSQQLGDMIEEYGGLKKRVEEFRKDNEVLNKIYDQNLELTQLLKEQKDSRGTT